MRDLTDCFLCPPGKECAGGTEDPTPCEAGFYCPGATWNSDSNPTAAISNKARCESINFCDGGEINPITCPTGSLCQGNALTSSCSAGSFCYEGIEEDCPAGGYCPIGTQQLIPCGRESPNGLLPGDPSAVGGIDEGSYCILCNEENYCPGDGGQYTCEDGFVCPQGTKYPTELCEEGNYCVDGKVEVCDAGKYQPGEGNFECIDCPTSLQCLPDTTTSPPETTIVSECPAGSFCDGTGPSQLCPAGTYRDIGAGQDQISECLPCPYGHFCDGGTGELTSDTTCDDGYECNEGSESINDQNPCPDGYYCIEGKKRPCDAGSYPEVSGAGANRPEICVPCPPGFYCPGEGVIELCLAGYYCPEGSFISRLKCDVGFVCPEGSAVQEYCDEGTKTTEINQGECVDCAEGFYCTARDENVDIDVDSENIRRVFKLMLTRWRQRATIKSQFKNSYQTLQR